MSRQVTYVREKKFAVNLGWKCLMEKRDKVTGEWSRLHNEELSDLYFLPNIVRVGKSRRIEMGGTCGAYGEGERCTQDSGGET